MNVQDIAYEVSLTLGDHNEDYDIDGIVDEITESYGYVGVDAVPSEEYWAIVESHDTTA